MKKTFLFILTGLCTFTAFTQQSVSTTGGNGAGSGGTVNYTVGQVVYTTNTGSNGSIAHGVQQPYEISVVTQVEEARDLTLQWSAYPNPASDNLKLRLLYDENSGLKVENMSYQLYDMYGKLLLNNKLDGEESAISMGNLNAGTYILKVTEMRGKLSRRELKTFKIIKH